MPLTICQSAGPSHMWCTTHRWYSAQLEWVPATQKCTTSLQDIRGLHHESAARALYTNTGNKLEQLLSPRNNRTWQAGTTWGRRWGEGWQGRDTDRKQELFLNTCWSFKTQWHFFTWANIFKVSFLAKFILNFTSQIYFLVWADWSDYLYSWPKLILCFHLALKTLSIPDCNRQHSDTYVWIAHSL